MADSVIVISDSDSESSRPPPLPVQTGSDPSQARPGPGKRRASPASGAGTAASPTCSCCPSDGRSLELQEIIDLTCEDVSTEQVPWSTLTIIDLTEDTCSPPHTTGGADQDHKQVPAALAAHMSHPQLCSTTTQETEATAGPSPAAPWHSSPAEPSAITDTAESTERWSCLSITSSHHGSSCSLEKDCSTTTFNSDLGSLASMQLDSDLLSLSPSSLDSSSSWKAGGPEEETPHLCQQRELPSRLSPAPAIPTTPGKAQGPFLGAGDLSPHKAIEQVMPDRTKADSKAWLNKLQCFRRSGVQHLFLQGIASDRETQQWKPELIPSGKLSMVHTTMEENFLEGTLHFLSDFVSRQHCPPKEIVSHLIRQILLDPQEEEILKDTYMLLMKIQMEVVKWLVAAVTGAGFFQAQEQPQETTSSSAEAKTEHSSSAPWLASTDQAEVAPPTFFAQKVMLLLQRMLSIAVEVDKSPNCSSCKIADVIFPFILHIPLRSQREAFFNTMESQLLRCRLLELVFQHSCDVPTTLPLSLAKILYFLNHFSVLLKYEDDTATWQRWDEMLQYLSLLLQSYQNVVLAFPLAEHLRSSLNERMDLIIQKAKPKLQDGDDISHLDIQLKIEDSISRMQQVLGQPFPLQITEKLCMLRELFLIVTAT
ncbi:SUMO-interacting motif-containing protein 1 isoform X7 [Falco biarmicus]|uniref:SUMO-interacting motif-containing protein 1 isoform X7 n=1 Tax=Falco rusticolus TaxID=120794 RepID=UPI0018869B93|nr:SUMO-interacting motif-containing protein 1 isoform X7 [Falco rusticolus]XP_055574373.1 SUMO-interacting motif-containing protein 1 isoform X7 [Falco cherrug]XP_056205087.1 SUMO-interacting motif-containing protein 1 isoform X7 [Falco biarmicus]